MAATDEPYNVARRAIADAADSPVSAGRRAPHPDGIDWTPLLGRRVTADDAWMRQTCQAHKTITGVVIGLGADMLGSDHVLVLIEPSGSTSINARRWTLTPMPGDVDPATRAAGS